MNIIEFHQGCTLVGKCWGGPVGSYYTIFGTEFGFLKNYLYLSLLVGFVLGMGLFVLNKTGKIKLPLYLIIVIPMLVTVILFFLLAYLFPIMVLY
ncbi:MAG: hypothetical protein WCV90_05280 [Candidatus Woesearchaeota archaeon]|jgi:hypothetical protein